MNSIAVLHTHLFQNDKKDSGFYFNTLERHLKANHKFIEKPHRHNAYLTVLFTKGSGVHEIDFQKYNVSEGSLFFLIPGQVHRWELSEDADGYIFFISPEYYDLHYVNLHLKDYPFFGSPTVSRKLEISAADLNKIVSLLEIIDEENQTQHLMKECVILALLTVVYTYSTRHYTEKETLSSDVKVAYFRHYHDFENLLEKHFKEKKSISEYADLLGISTKHLNRITQTVVQKTASAMLTDRLMLEAKRMLMYLDDHVVDIAFRLGYEDYSYFSRVFRKNVGFSPTRFIQKYKS